MFKYILYTGLISLILISFSVFVSNLSPKTTMADNVMSLQSITPKEQKTITPKDSKNIQSPVLLTTNSSSLAVLSSMQGLLSIQSSSFATSYPTKNSSSTSVSTTTALNQSNASSSSTGNSAGILVVSSVSSSMSSSPSSIESVSSSAISISSTQISSQISSSKKQSLSVTEQLSIHKQKPFISQINYATVTESGDPSCSISGNNNMCGYDKWVEIYNPNNTRLDLTEYGALVGNSEIIQPLTDLVIEPYSHAYLVNIYKDLKPSATGNLRFVSAQAIGSETIGFYGIRIVDSNEAVYISSPSVRIVQTQKEKFTLNYCKDGGEQKLSDKTSIIKSFANGSMIYGTVNVEPSMREVCRPKVIEQMPIITTPTNNINILNNKTPPPSPIEQSAKESVKAEAKQAATIEVSEVESVPSIVPVPASANYVYNNQLELSSRLSTSPIPEQIAVLSRVFSPVVVPIVSPITSPTLQKSEIQDVLSAPSALPVQNPVFVIKGWKYEGSQNSYSSNSNQAVYLDSISKYNLTKNNQIYKDVYISQKNENGVEVQKTVKVNEFYSRGTLWYVNLALCFAIIAQGIKKQKINLDTLFQRKIQAQ